MRTIFTLPMMDSTILGHRLAMMFQPLPVFAQESTVHIVRPFGVAHFSKRRNNQDPWIGRTGGTTVRWYDHLHGRDKASERSGTPADDPFGGRHPTSHERMTGLPWDASYHQDSPAPWDVGRPQPAIAR